MIVLMISMSLIVQSASRQYSNVHDAIIRVVHMMVASDDTVISSMSVISRLISSRTFTIMSEDLVRCIMAVSYAIASMRYEPANISGFPSRVIISAVHEYRGLFSVSINIPADTSSL